MSSKRTALFDTEGDGLLQDVTQLWCAHVLELDKNNKIINETTFTPENIDDLPSFLKQFDRFIGHNIIQYDLAVLTKLYGVRYDVEIIDTLLISRIQRPNRRAPSGVTAGPHSVEAWGVRLGAPKQAHEDWSRFSPEMLTRCISDTHIQLELLSALTEEGKGEGWENAHKLVSKMYQYLQKQEEYGFYVDQDHMQWCLDTLSRWMLRIEQAVSPYLPLVVEPLESKAAGVYNYVKKPFKKDGRLCANCTNIYGWKSDC